MPLRSFVFKNIAGPAGGRTPRALPTLLAFAAALFLAACGSKAPGPGAHDSLPPGTGADLWKQFSGDRAMDQVRAQVALGPRPSGTATLEKARAHITQTLQAAGWEVERQEFDAAPVRSKGPLKFVNLIARFSAAAARPVPTTTQRAIVCSHYDTKRMLGVTFVGANDGGSSTGALLELARVLAQEPKLAEQVELVFFDGEEAIERFAQEREPYEDPTGTPDGLVGSRYYAAHLREGDRARQFHFAVLWDMIGDKELVLTLPTDSPKPLSDAFFQAADTLGTRDHVGFYGSSVLDDHVPLEHIAHIPAIDLIDFDYGPWHTSADTLDKLSPASLQVIGQLTVAVLVRELAK